MYGRDVVQKCRHIFIGNGLCIAPLKRYCLVEMFKGFEPMVVKQIDA